MSKIQMSKIEAALFFLFDGIKLLGVMISHVDDLYSAGEGKKYNDTIAKMEVELHLKIKKGEFRLCGRMQHRARDALPWINMMPSRASTTWSWTPAAGSSRMPR